MIDTQNHLYELPGVNGGTITNDIERYGIYPTISNITSDGAPNSYILRVFDNETNLNYYVTFTDGKFAVIDGSENLSLCSLPSGNIATYEKDGKYGFVKLSFDGIDGYAESKEAPSSWAKAEVDAAIEAGLVPAELQKNYTKGISRGDLAKMLSVLIDIIYGKDPDVTSAKFKDTNDADVLKAANLGLIKGYDAGNGEYNFKPGNTLKRSEMSAIINRVAKLCGKTTTGYENEVKFTDTASHWCNSELGYPVHMGIVKGTSETTFSPENTLTVEQTIMMIYRTFKALK